MSDYQVALESYEVDGHEQGPAGVAVQHLDALHQIGAELVASLQHAQHHDVVVTQVVHDVSRQPLRPATTRHDTTRPVTRPSSKSMQRTQKGASK